MRRIDTKLSDRERLFAKLARNIGRGLDVIYHGTRAPTEVLRSGKLMPDGSGKVSFSRSPEVAAYFALLMAREGDRWAPAVLVFNRTSLAQTYRLDPWRYCEDWADEQEEVVWDRTINFRRHLLGVVTESNVNKVLGPRKHTFYPNDFDDWSQARRSAFFREEFKGETLVKAGRARVRDIIVRERKMLSMQNARTSAQAFKTMDRLTTAQRTQQRNAPSKPTVARFALNKCKPRKRKRSRRQT